MVLSDIDIDVEGFSNCTDPHPGGHVVGVCLSLVVVEDHDGGDHAGGHHEHDAVEVSPWRGTKGQIKVEVRCIPPPPRCC